jgi:hypothetical protein
MIYNKVFLVNSEIAVDIGVTSFSLYEGDLLFTNDERICTLIYQTTWSHDKGILHLSADKQRVFTFIRIANRTGWTPLSESLGNQLTDITTQYKRDQLLDTIL